MSNSPVLQEERVPVKSRIWISIADSSTAILQSLVAASALTYYFVKLRGTGPKDGRDGLAPFWDMERN